jgi:ubiquinone/menaquinone biosynthesis C-methylase UbiE
MRRYEESVLRKLETYCREKDVLEIGCGDGSRLAEVVRTSKSWYGIDPDSDAVRQANATNESPRAEFSVGSAEQVNGDDARYDVVLFALSLHHMDAAIIPEAFDEALRVLRADGLVIFLEPLPEGTFFDAEMRFGCCDGDERRELAYAYYSMLSEERLHEIEEFVTQVSVEYDSFDDFKKNVPTMSDTLAQLESYLSSEGFRLDEKWRLNVFERSG